MTRATGAVVLFTRDLRVRDHAGLAEAAARFDHVAPMFVLDDRLVSGAAANRLSFLLEALADLRASLRERGADLILRCGEPVAETLRLARETRCDTVFVTADASGYAQERERRLALQCRREGLQLRVAGSTSLVPPGALTPDGRDHYRVFTPYWRRWSGVRPPAPWPTPGRLTLSEGAAPGELPVLRELTDASPSPDLPRGGERAGRARLERWASSGALHRYATAASTLAADATSRLSPYLHLGCVSPADVVRHVGAEDGAEAFLRQLCWRDFFLQLLAADPSTASRDLRPRPIAWRVDNESLERWREGRTGWPIVDAGMRQLRAEGWLPNRARLIVGSFLTRTLRLDWRSGARLFGDVLVDGDVASNAGNWQWVAGTGANPRPNQALAPLRQAARFDPQGDYVRRHVPELAHLAGAAIHEPWRAPSRSIPSAYRTQPSAPQ